MSDERDPREVELEQHLDKWHRFLENEVERLADSVQQFLAFNKKMYLGYARRIAELEEQLAAAKATEQ